MKGYELEFTANPVGTDDTAITNLTIELDETSLGKSREHTETRKSDSSLEPDKGSDLPETPMLVGKVLLDSSRNDELS